MITSLCPLFAGENPLVWIEAMEDIFDELQVPWESHVDMCISYLRGTARDWFFYTDEIVGEKDWCAFSYKLLWKFDPQKIPVQEELGIKNVKVQRNESGSNEGSNVFQEQVDPNALISTEPPELVLGFLERDSFSNEGSDDGIKEVTEVRAAVIASLDTSVLEEEGVSDVTSLCTQQLKDYQYKNLSLAYHQSRDVLPFAISDSVKFHVPLPVLELELYYKRWFLQRYMQYKLLDYTDTGWSLMEFACDLQYGQRVYWNPGDHHIHARQVFTEMPDNNVRELHLSKWVYQVNVFKEMLPSKDLQFNGTIKVYTRVEYVPLYADDATPWPKFQVHSHTESYTVDALRCIVQEKLIEKKQVTAETSIEYRLTFIPELYETTKDERPGVCMLMFIWEGNLLLASRDTFSVSVSTPLVAQSASSSIEVIDLSLPFFFGGSNSDNVNFTVHARNKMKANCTSLYSEGVLLPSEAYGSYNLTTVQHFRSNNNCSRYKYVIDPYMFVVFDLTLSWEPGPVPSQCQIGYSLLSIVYVDSSLIHIMNIRNNCKKAQQTSIQVQHMAAQRSLYVLVFLHVIVQSYNGGIHWFHPGPHKRKQFMSVSFFINSYDGFVWLQLITRVVQSCLDFQEPGRANSFSVRRVCLMRILCVMIFRVGIFVCVEPLRQLLLILQHCGLATLLLLQCPGYFSLSLIQPSFVTLSTVAQYQHSHLARPTRDTQDTAAVTLVTILQHRVLARRDMRIQHDLFQYISDSEATNLPIGERATFIHSSKATKWISIYKVKVMLLVTFNAQHCLTASKEAARDLIDKHYKSSFLVQPALFGQCISDSNAIHRASSLLLEFDLRGYKNIVTGYFHGTTFFWLLKSIFISYLQSCPSLCLWCTTSDYGDMRVGMDACPVLNGCVFKGGTCIAAVSLVVHLAAGTYSGLVGISQKNDFYVYMLATRGILSREIAENIQFQLDITKFLKRESMHMVVMITRKINKFPEWFVARKFFIPFSIDIQYSTNIYSPDYLIKFGESVVFYIVFFDPGIIQIREVSMMLWNFQRDRVMIYIAKRRQLYVMITSSEHDNNEKRYVEHLVDQVTLQVKAFRSNTYYLRDVPLTKKWIGVPRSIVVMVRYRGQDNCIPSLSTVCLCLAQSARYFSGCRKVSYVGVDVSLRLALLFNGKGVLGCSFIHGILFNTKILSLVVDAAPHMHKSILLFLTHTLMLSSVLVQAVWCKCLQCKHMASMTMGVSDLSTKVSVLGPWKSLGHPNTKNVTITAARNLCLLLVYINFAQVVRFLKGGTSFFLLLHTYEMVLSISPLAGCTADNSQVCYCLIIDVHHTISLDIKIQQLKAVSISPKLYYQGLLSNLQCLHVATLVGVWSFGTEIWFTYSSLRTRISKEGGIVMYQAITYAQLRDTQWRPRPDSKGQVQHTMDQERLM